MFFELLFYEIVMRADKKLKLMAFALSHIFSGAAQCSKLMRMNCMIALWAVKLINLWKSVLLVRRRAWASWISGERCFSWVIYCSDGNCVTSYAANCQRHTVVLNFNYKLPAAEVWVLGNVAPEKFFWRWLLLKVDSH